MRSFLPTLLLLFTAAVPQLDTKFVQVAPIPLSARISEVVRSPNQRRAVLLIEGLNLHLFNHQLAAKPDLRPWQRPSSPLVQALGRDSDVFAFTYAQVIPVNDIAEVAAFGECIQRLHKAGYTEIVLVGFSAGGVIARQFVEDNPAAGVTKVVQVCTPNTGSSLANLKLGGAAQKPFLESLTAKARGQSLAQRSGKKIPTDVQFVCVVGNGLINNDGVVATHSQWSADLQGQGVPALVVDTDHWNAVTGERQVLLIARLVRENQPRWDAAQVALFRKRLRLDGSK